MNLISISLMLLLFSFCSTSCTKEYSIEGQQTLLSTDSIDCSTLSVYGDYVKNSDLTENNNIICQVNVANPGKYVAYSDTVNGFFFLGAGEPIKSGKQIITLKGHGRMLTQDTTNFTLHFNNLVCNFTILPTQAAYSFLNVNNNCDGTIIPFGKYKAGELLTNSGGATVNVNVTHPGYYSLQTPIVNGIRFSAKGTFINTGPQSITIIAMGIPKVGGKFQFPISVLNSNCSFFIDVDYKSIDTSMYYSFDANGKHYFGYIDSALLGNIVTPTGEVKTLSIGSLITNITDTALNLTLSRINNFISSGIYHSAIISNEDYAGGMDFSNSRGLIYYSSNDLPAFQINLLSYSNVGQLVKGEFHGPVLNDMGQMTQIINGSFKTYLAHF